MVNVFAIVQALSLGAEECPRVVFLYGFEFRTASMPLFDLDWYKLYKDIFQFFDTAQTKANVENETGLRI